MSTATATKKPAARKPIYREGLSDPLEKVTYKNGWQPQVKFDPQSGAPQEITTDVVPDDTKPEDAIRELGVTLPPGYKLVLVSFTVHKSYTEHAWTREEQGEDAVTRPNRSKRVQWKFQVVKDETVADDHDTTLIFDRIEKMWKKVHRPDRRKYTKRRQEPVALVVAQGDEQAGKCDKYGGTPELLRRDATLLENVVEYIEEVRPDVIYNLHGGDLIENLFNVSTQIAENDLTLDEQIEVGLDIRSMWNAELSKYAPVHSAMAPSNHGRVRTSMGTPGYSPGADWGVRIERMAHKMAMRQGLDVTLHLPDDKYTEWVMVPVYDTTLGLIHGHQVKGGSTGIKPFMNQHSINRSPLFQADHVIVAHNHDEYDVSLGRGPKGLVRRAFGLAPKDGGSSWFEQMTGADSDPGLSTFLIRPTHGYDSTSLKRWHDPVDIEIRRQMHAF